MSARWNLGYKNKMISYEEFVDLTTQFSQNAEAAFGTKCMLEIKAMSEPKQYTTFMDDTHQHMLDKINERNTLLVASNIEDVTEDKWRESRYVEVFVRPVDKAAAPSYAFGRAEFRGLAPNMATFYVQGGDKTASVKENMIAANKKMSVGDGYESNGRNSGFIPHFSASSALLNSELSARLYENEHRRAQKSDAMYKGNPVVNFLRMLARPVFS